MSDPRAIGVFDSGIGGLTVVHELFKILPNERIVYFGDTARVPYGTKSPKVVERFALEDIFFLLQQDVKLIIAACHTVSSVALDQIVQAMHLPILGVVDPGVKAALKITENHKIGIIGTRATVLSRAYDKKLKAKDEQVTVVSRACPLFVPMAEEGWLDGPIVQNIARTYLDPIRAEGVDTLILGCTHYPLLKPVIGEVMGESIKIIDSAEQTAKLVAYRLNVLKKNNPTNQIPKHAFFVSDIPHQFREIGERFLQTSLDNLTQIDLEAMKMKDDWQCRNI